MPRRDEDLQRLVTECGGKIHCFNNNKNVKGQVQYLPQKIETMMIGNGGMFIMEQMRRRHSMVSIVNCKLFYCCDITFLLVIFYDSFFYELMIMSEI